ncbi:MAG TPA: hypothetical protein PKJ94_00700 [Ferruginibacter sp.]|nr:hypothetical protein [Ferruginibacter sp.]
MNKKEHINKLVEEALESVDQVSRAEAKPFLLTRINARMNKETESVWEKAGWFIGRPAVAFSGLCMIILINLAVLLFNQPSNTVTPTEQVAQSPTDEFSYSIATIYDTENTQP